MQQYEYEPEVIDYEPIYKPKHPLVHKICGYIATFFDRLLILIIGIIIGAGGLAIVQIFL